MSELIFKAAAFVCPLCQVHSQQAWTTALQNPHCAPYQDLWWGTCLNCNRRTIWFQQRLVAPVATSAPPPNPDMPENIRLDYEEARDISERSPRSAAGLLRLCIEKLCIELGESGKNLNANIGSLVAKGLPRQIQQAFDTVRIVGNSQLHRDDSGIDLRSDPKSIMMLFRLVNLIVENQISLPRETQEIYSSLPASSRDAVEERTRKALETQTVEVTTGENT